MRSKVVISGISFVLVVLMASVATFATTSTPGSAEDAYEQRISDLETRVAALEEEVGLDGDAEETSQQGSVSTSSSQVSISSSSEQGVSSYSASFSANGDRAIEFEISNASTYDLTANAEEPFELRVETLDGDPVPGFTLESDEGETMKASDHLEPGTYVLHVSTSSAWNVTIISFDD